MKWNRKWNGTEILVWKMPEWNERFQEWKGRISSILPYQYSILDFVYYTYRKIHTDVGW